MKTMNRTLKFPSEYLADAFTEIVQDFAEVQVIDEDLHIHYPKEAEVLVHLVHASVLAGYEAAFIEASQMAIMLPSTEEIH